MATKIRPIVFRINEPTPIITTLSVVIEPLYSQYCFVVPVDILLACKTNGLTFSITAHTTVTGTGPWQTNSNDARIFLTRPNNYSTWYVLLGDQYGTTGVTPFVAIDANGYRGMTITNQDLQSASLTTLQSWKDNYGDTTVLMNPPSTQSNKFTEPPTCVMTYYA